MFGLVGAAITGFVTVNGASVHCVCTESYAALGWVVKVTQLLGL